MSPNPLNLPEAVIRRARAHGPDGVAWLADLPGYVDALAAEWRITLGRTHAGGTAGYVADASTDDGVPTILKVKFPGEDPARAELRTLLAGDGRGYVRVLRSDVPNDAMLLERLGPQLVASGLPVATQVELAATTLAQAWRPAVDPTGFVDGAQKADVLEALITSLQDSLGKPCSPQLVGAALRFLAERRRAFDPTTSVLAHGDPHPANALLVPGSTPPQVKFVDPEGLFIEPAYDLGILMREWDDDLLAGDPIANGVARCRRLSQLTGIAPTAIWHWGLIERVSSGLYVLQLGMPEMSRSLLAIAERWAEIDAP